jgi:hypothetical protein
MTWFCLDKDSQKNFEIERGEKYFKQKNNPVAGGLAKRRNSTPNFALANHIS